MPDVDEIAADAACRAYESRQKWMVAAIGRHLDATLKPRGSESDEERMREVRKAFDEAYNQAQVERVKTMMGC